MVSGPIALSAPSTSTSWTYLRPTKRLDRSLGAPVDVGQSWVVVAAAGASTAVIGRSSRSRIG